MRILILSQWFQPEQTFKGLPLARALRDRGHEVEVLTGFPNYPGGRFYPGYRVRPWRIEVMDDVRVNRVALYPSHSGSGLGRVLNYTSFGASAALVGPWLVRRPDVVYVFNLVTLGPAAGVLRRLGGSRVVLDVQDLWPESVAGSGLLRSRLLLGALGRWCRAAYRGADRLVVQSPGFQRNLIARGVPEEKIDMIYNWCDETALAIPDRDPVLARVLGFAGRFNVIFAGTMGAMQALGPVIECARGLRDRSPDVLFTFIGGGIDVGRLQGMAHGLENVRFLERRPASEIGPILAQADALLVHLKDDPLFRITIPSKIQAYLFAGRPILCGVEGDAADLVRRAGAGLTFGPEDPESLARAIGALRDAGPDARRRMGASGAEFYREHLAMNEGVRRMEAAFQAALGAPGRVRSRLVSR
jgi:colanic acid biosynthesis glycosyl transferase WcaI